jgi:hypothetical protein
MKRHPYIIYSKFRGTVEDSREWWKGHPHMTSKEVECSGFYRAVENGGKGIYI